MNKLPIISFVIWAASCSITVAFTTRSHHNTPYTNTAYTSTPSNPPIRLRESQVLSKQNHLSYYRDLNMSAASQESQNPKSLSKRLIEKIGSTTSMVVAGTFFLALAYQRNDYMITFFIGSILNGITSKILKKVLNVDRPQGYENEDSVTVKPSDKGMPSSHAMSLGFIGTYCIIEAFQALGVRTDSVMIAFSLVLYATVSLVYRVQSKLHTLDQIVAGLFFGVSNSFIWHSLAMGENFIFPKVNLMQTVSYYLLPESGILPVKYLAIPALVGAAVVGSLERRISAFLKSRKSKSQ